MHRPACRLSRSFSHLELLYPFDNFDSVEAHFDSKVLFQVCVCDMVNNLSIDTNLLFSGKLELKYNTY